jgi:hypothetical protein
MSILDDIARPFWLTGLNQISGPQPKGIGGLICDENYQIYSQMTPVSFVLCFADPEPFLEAFAGDISRIGSASFESAIGIMQSPALPKSIAWLVVQTYYSAFFSAHSILRALGESCTPIERDQVNSLMRVGGIFGTAPSPRVKGGLFHLVCNARARTISGTALSGSPHEVFWRIFNDRMSRLSCEALNVSTESLANRQLASAKLFELTNNLCFRSTPRGNWLSSVRNAVNYNQKFSTWYPYSGRQKYYEQMFSKVMEWNEDPLDLSLNTCEDRDLRRFQVTCNFIIGAFRSLIADMAGRCTSGRSFHNFGALACLNHAKRIRT